MVAQVGKDFRPFFTINVLLPVSVFAPLLVATDASHGVQ